MPTPPREHPDRFVVVVDGDDDERMVTSRIAAGLVPHVSEYARGDAFLADFDPDRSGCVLLELRLPGVEGLAVQDALRDLGAVTPVVIVTAHGSSRAAVQALKGGAFDFLEKPVDPRELRECIQNALDLDAERRLLLDRIQAYEERFRALTRREREVARLMIEGESSKFIAVELGISEKTVESHRHRILKKMHARGIIDFVRESLEVDWLSERRPVVWTSRNERTAGLARDGGRDRVAAPAYEGRATVTLLLT